MSRKNRKRKGWATHEADDAKTKARSSRAQRVLEACGRSQQPLQRDPSDRPPEAADSRVAATTRRSATGTGKSTAQWRGHYGVVGGKDATSKLEHCQADQPRQGQRARRRGASPVRSRRRKSARSSTATTGAPRRTGRGPGRCHAGADYLKLKKPLIFNPDASRPSPSSTASVCSARRAAVTAGTFQPFGDPIDHIREALEPVFESIPTIMLDGELYNHTLHADFNELSSIIRKQTCTPDQRRAQRLIEYHVYDCPSHGQAASRRGITARSLQRVRLLAGPHRHGADDLSAETLTELDRSLRAMACGRLRRPDGSAQRAL
jgi:hypothetical protein